MSRLTLNTQKLTVSAMVLGLASIAGPATAQQFTISATVQNAVTILPVTPLNFGTVFATSTGTASGAISDSSKLTINANTGVVTAAKGADAPAIVSLGGATPGSFTIPNLPIGSSIYIDLQDSGGNSITNAATGTAATALTCSYADPAAAIVAKKIVLTAGGPGAGDFDAFFCVDRFTAFIGTADQTEALLQQVAVAGTGYAVPGVSAGTVAFTLGASLVGSASGAVVPFGTGAYSGNFNMEVNFK